MPSKIAGGRGSTTITFVDDEGELMCSAKPREYFNESFEVLESKIFHQTPSISVYEKPVGISIVFKNHFERVLSLQLDTKHE